MKQVCRVYSTDLSYAGVVSIHARFSTSHLRKLPCRARVLAKCPSASAIDFLPPKLDTPMSTFSPPLNSDEIPSVLPTSCDDEETSKCMGAILGAMCGNVLGAPVQNDRHWVVMKRWPDGLTDFWRFDVGPDAVPFGHYTGDFSLLLATTKSLVTSASCSAPDIAKALSELTEAEQHASRNYSPYARLVLTALSEPGVRLASIPYLAEKFLNATTSRRSHITSDRSEQEPFGPSDNGAAARILPVALAFRNKSVPQLFSAVHEACSFSHAHTIGMEGARVAAATAHWLIQQQRPATASDTVEAAAGKLPDHPVESGPEALLKYLLEKIAMTDDMRGKLKLMQKRMFQMDKVRSWRQMYETTEWSTLVSVHSSLTRHDYATSGTEAVAVALWCLVTNWCRPEQAVIVSATLAGSVPVTSQITGGFAGTLHGLDWIPERWLKNLENGVDGRDQVLELARGIAGFDSLVVLQREDDPDFLVDLVEENVENN
ncbi:hypothetical protein CEUSTIGMA_g5424.t1 [Chlamydomonas eustigma]|uniref:ADP-ribosylhydrolase ARH3 n=1 Tax=Chlamydomonas eustigma TaxID=1157962 RepID=A0A250X518_9CHLO|nr:hypothetical protein CEUSTIGMA_g5424.t1 [Chlamydomonas eustigma]|eukprot:GAX77982.1 hypothetical protein CEUSTIGMA_g5424.t1 [Chlamydomonas eustigma]